MAFVSVLNQSLDEWVRAGPCFLSIGNGDQLKITPIHNEQILPDCSFLLLVAIMLDSLDAYLKNSALEF